MTALVGYLLTLFATILLELPITAALAPRGTRRLMVLTMSSLNLFTHPIATLLAWHGAAFFPVEAIVTAIELVGLHVVGKVSWSRATAIAVAANSLTAIVAILIGALSSA